MAESVMWAEYGRCTLCGARAGDPCIIIDGDDMGKTRSEPHPYRCKDQSQSPTIDEVIE